MKENHLEEALKKTIEEETRERQRQRETGEVNPTVLIDMQRHREFLQNSYNSVGEILPKIIVATLGNPITYLVGATALYSWLKG